MPRDFTVDAFALLMVVAARSGYALVAYEDFAAGRAPGRCVILRHDVDLKPANALRFAHIQREIGARGTYYFRIVPESFHPDIVEQIADLGHEIGYHYEDLTLQRGDVQRALRAFEENLARFRRYYTVTTACMHGSPASRWDNRAVWKEADYRRFGIKAEPYFDTDFDRVLYLTDTGRSWNNAAFSVRDRVDSDLQRRFRFSSTDEIVRAFDEGRLPDQVMINTHPQRWNDGFGPWTGELVMQNAKNVVKRLLVARRRPAA